MNAPCYRTVDRIGQLAIQLYIAYVYIVDSEK